MHTNLGRGRMRKTGGKLFWLPRANSGHTCESKPWCPNHVFFVTSSGFSRGFPSKRLKYCTFRLLDDSYVQALDEEDAQGTREGSGGKHQQHRGSLRNLDLEWDDSKTQLREATEEDMKTLLREEAAATAAPVAEKVCESTVWDLKRTITLPFSSSVGEAVSNFCHKSLSHDLAEPAVEKLPAVRIICRSHR